MSSVYIRFSLFKTQGRAQPNTAVPVCSILNSDFSLIPVFASLPLAGSVQHGQRLDCPHGFSLRVVLAGPVSAAASVGAGRHWRPAPPLRDSVAGRKCSMPPASRSPGGCRPAAGGCPPVAPGQRVPYAYTDLFSFQGTKGK